jgi:hypothetical protein
MKTCHKIMVLVTSILLPGFLAACAAPPPQPPGTITGTMKYEQLSGGGSAEPVPDMLIALCRVPAAGLPDGPIVASSNRGKTEHICTVQGAPTAVTDKDGAFTLASVPPATYLVMFHLSPAAAEASRAGWNGVALTEASFNEIDGKVPSSSKPDFWEDGGPAIALASWSASEGMTVTTGNVCSDKFGFCFSIRDGHAQPVIEVKPSETVEIELTTHLKSKK